MPNDTDCLKLPVTPPELVVAGIIGGLIGVAISVIIIAGITGIVFGSMILMRRNR